MRRLLLVAYYFPPSGGAGVQRPLKWAKYLPEFGVAPTVLTVEAGAYPKLDASLAADLPAGVAVRRTPALDPFSAYARLTGRTREEAVDETTGHIGRGATPLERLARWVRANVFVPDARVGWAPFAVREGLRLLRSEPFDAVLTTGPPHSVHLTGWALHARTGTPWIADFRDPWTDIGYLDALPRTGLAERADRALERAVLRRASRVVTVSPAWRDLLAGKVERPRSAFAVVRNGYDPEDFGPAPEPPAERFTLVHVGSLYGSRSPAALWEALARLRAAAPALRVRLVGRLGADVQAELERSGLAGVVEAVPYLPHREAVREMQRASALLLAVEPSRHEEGHVPGKLYEYLAAGRPVVGVGPAAGDAADLLREHGAGRMFGREDAAGIEAHLRALYGAWERGAMPAGADPARAATFSRRAQAGELAGLIDSLSEPARHDDA